MDEELGDGVSLSGLFDTLRGGEVDVCVRRQSGHGRGLGVRGIGAIGGGGGFGFESGLEPRHVFDGDEVGDGFDGHGVIAFEVGFKDALNVAGDVDDAVVDELVFDLGIAEVGDADLNGVDELYGAAGLLARRSVLDEDDCAGAFGGVFRLGDGDTFDEAEEKKFVHVCSLGGVI